jgi:peptidoglycan/LPS O-acetylase OafA/YrhL
MKTKINNRYLELDALRGIAAIMVVLFHFTTHYKKRFDSELDLPIEISYGWLGVHLFFVISGFVIFMTLLKTKRPMDFVVSRFSRLFPAYWVAIILTFTIVYFSNIEQLKVPLLDAAVNFSMLQSVFYLKNVDGVYWTLFIELLFYFWMAIIFFYVKLEKIKFIFLGAMLFQLLSILSESYYGWFPWIITKFFILEYIHLFAIGVSFYRIQNSNGDNYFEHLNIGVGLLIQFLYHGSIEGVALIIITFVFYLFITDNLKWILNKPVIFAGQISYSLYLIHQNIGYIILQNLMSIGFNFSLAFVITAALITFTAYLMYSFIERLSLVYLRSRYKAITS